jgi:hypothetical protein
MLIEEEDRNLLVQQNTTEAQSLSMKKDPFLFNVRDTDPLPCNITSSY